MKRIRPPKSTRKIHNISESQSELTQIRALATELVGRSSIMAKLGKSYGGTRDIYTALGYPFVLTFDDYEARYNRQDVAKRIITAPVNAAWRKKPTLTENEDKPTKFEERWEELVKDYKIYQYLTRVDRMSGIGQFAVLLVGLADGQEDLTKEAGKAKALLYLRPYKENNIEVKVWETEVTNERYGLPRIYTLTTSTTEGATKPIDVHYSRIIHVAEDLDENDIYGTPKLKNVYNRLQDLELVAGGSAEMFWRGAFPGLGFMADADADMKTMDTTAFETEIENYVHGLKRYMKLQGMNIEALAQQVADPKGHVDVLISIIAGATGIPKRMLLGSERGELASSQDERAWNDRVDERRKDHCEPTILRPLIDLFIKVDILPEPSEQYVVEWPDISAPTEKDEAETSTIRTEALAKYVSSPGDNMIVPPEMFMSKFLGLTEDEIAQALEMIETMKKEEADQIAADEALMDEEEELEEEEI